MLIVADRLLRIGSSNLNNRSMGLDTECDIAIEAADGDEAMRREILRIRDGLLAEHLGVPQPLLFDAAGEPAGDADRPQARRSIASRYLVAAMNTRVILGPPKAQLAQTAGAGI